MDNVDLRYVVGAMAALSGIPVRLLEGEQLVLFKSPVKLLRDPAALYRQEICSVRGHVGYFATPCFHYYGVLNAPGGTIVMGPTCQIMAGEQELRELAFRLDVPREEVPSFLTAMNDPGDTAEMLSEMGSIGVTMAVIVTVTWLVIILVADRILARPEKEPEKAAA